jgi:hypothetical protein
MTERMSTELATCGRGTLPGMVWRAGDPVKHLGPPPHLDIHLWSQLFSTRCGLNTSDGPWQAASVTDNDDDNWCPACLAQAGIPHSIVRV